MPVPIGADAVTSQSKSRPLMMFDTLRADFRAVFERDPAVRNGLEVVFAYPGFHAILMHRISHWLWPDVPVLPRWLSHVARFLTGIEIHPGAQIGKGFFIDHGMGVVIGETTTIGDNVTLYQGVTLGGTGKERGKRHPTIGDDVLISVNAKVLGAITIGDHAKIGAGSVVLTNVPPHCTAVGVPARVVATHHPDTDIHERVEVLPDPEGETIQALLERVVLLEARLAALQAHVDATSADPFARAARD
ncbi:MAG: serine O-acetyltransferase [Chloroflexota bacterium]|jgi:serine O-acetyltransferase|nr:serine O-acetyltransferase [Chloroflexota bacterium]